ncbi:MAG: DivIVA domain-containing protein [Nocardioidaceae bacterium]
MTEQQERSFPYYRSPSTIRTEAFSHRMRGLDEAEVREFLDLLADQVQAGDLERTEMRTENERLREEVEQLRTQQPIDGDINPQAVLLFSQAQQVADQLVEEAVIHARDLMTSARNQQREIMQETQSVTEAGRGPHGHGMGFGGPATVAPGEYPGSVPDVEYVRTFARVAQVQLRSVVDALSEQVDRLGDVPDQLEGDSRWVFQETTAGVITQRDWRVEPVPPQRPADRGL